MEYTAGNVYKAIDMLAPFGGCMAWDNVGLLVGEPDSAVTGILVTLDVTPAAVAQALEMRMNCIVSHHPIIFHPLKHISARDAAGLCLANGISVISAHTNYDFAPRGVNCALAQTLGLRNIRPFGPEDKEKPWYSIIVFVPKSHAEAVYRTMSEAGAGRQGNYSGCAYMNDGEGRFLPEAGGYVLPYADSPLDDERVGESVYLDILSHAERYVRIFTPYLILDETMVMALTFAAKRGVDVELILPHVPDKKFAFALAKGHYRELLDAGVKIYEYTPGFVHAKVFVSDDCKAVVGTINLDYRSLYLHFENAVYLYDCPCIADIVADFDATRAQSQIVTHGDLARIPLHTRITSALLKLVAPLM